MGLTRFLRVYNRLPSAERKMPCVVIGGKSYTWEEAYEQIRRGTRIGEKIQRALESMGII